MGSLPIWIIALAAVAGYMLGSVPFGLIATQLGGGGDIRKVGSGNIGATNVLRTGRKDLAVLTLLGDAGKGAVAVGLAWLIGGALPLQERTVLAAVAGGGAFIGHVYSAFLRFKGGKGVATFFGILLAIAWPVGLLAGATWLAMARLFRLSSLAALTAAALSPLFAFATDRPYPVIVLSVVMAVVIFIRHYGNIRRLIAGTEPRIGAAKTPPPAGADDA